MSKFKFSYDDQQLVLDVITNYVHNGLQQSQLFDRIEQIVSERDGWIDVGAVWQKCPKCDGQGTVSKPPWIAGDVYEWSSTSVSHQCNVCNGAMIIPSPPKQP